MLTLSEVEVPVRAQSIDLRDAVTAERAAALERFEEAAVGLGTWAAGSGSRLPLHRFEADLFERLMALGCLLVALWWSHRTLTVTPAVLRRSGGHYGYRARLGRRLISPRHRPRARAADHPATGPLDSRPPSEWGDWEGEAPHRLRVAAGVPCLLSGADGRGPFIQYR